VGRISVFFSSCRINERRAVPHPFRTAYGVDDESHRCFPRCGSGFLVGLMTLLLIGAGSFSLRRLPVDAYPDLAPPMVQVITPVARARARRKKSSAPDSRLPVEREDERQFRA